MTPRISNMFKWANFVENGETKMKLSSCDGARMQGIDISPWQILSNIRWRKLYKKDIHLNLPKFAVVPQSHTSRTSGEQLDVNWSKCFINFLLRFANDTMNQFMVQSTMQVHQSRWWTCSNYRVAGHKLASWWMDHSDIIVVHCSKTILSMCVLRCPLVVCSPEP